MRPPMPRGTERSLIYVRDIDAQGHLVIRAVPREGPPPEPPRDMEMHSAKD